MGRGPRLLIAGILALCCLRIVAAVPKKSHAPAGPGHGHGHGHGQQPHTDHGGHLIYKDPSQPIEARVKDLLSRMNLTEKIGQMTQIERKVAKDADLKKYTIGSLLSGGGSVPGLRATPEMWMDMVDKYQKVLLSTRLGIPMIYGIDAVHGNNNAYRATIFPHNIGLGATREPGLARRIGHATALECRATGIPYAFAPCVAVCRDPRWGRCYESYSEDTKIVTQFTEIIHGLQGNMPANHQNGYPYLHGQHHVIACAKHYVGDGGTHHGINENNTALKRETLMKIHMPPYPEAIRKGVATVMISYSSWNGVKMHAHHELITDHLKHHLGFKGFVISDWEGIDKITTPQHKNYTYSILASINAGIDMVMVPENYDEFITGLTKLVNTHFIPMTRIDDAVRRILRVKFAMGLFEHPLADRSLGKHLGSAEHRELAREAVRKSLVLLKNGKHGQKPLLPLHKKATKILVAGTHANDIGLQCGGWTIEWHGVHGNKTVGTTILQGIKSAIDKTTHVVYQPTPNQQFIKSQKFDYAIVVVGEEPYAETRGDTKNLTIPQPGPRIISDVCSSVKCVVVLITGRPVLIQNYIDKIDALVAAWLPGSEAGHGIADVLFGDYGFTGRLPITWPRTLDQIPIHPGGRKPYNPLFAFDFGLRTQPIHGTPHHTKKQPHGHGTPHTKTHEL